MTTTKEHSKLDSPTERSKSKKVVNEEERRLRKHERVKLLAEEEAIQGSFTQAVREQAKVDSVSQCFEDPIFQASADADFARRQARNRRKGAKKAGKAAGKKRDEEASAAAAKRVQLQPLLSLTEPEAAPFQPMGSPVFVGAVESIAGPPSFSLDGNEVGSATKDIIEDDAQDGSSGSEDGAIRSDESEDGNCVDNFDTRTWTEKKPLSKKMQKKLERAASNDATSKASLKRLPKSPPIVTDKAAAKKAAKEAYAAFEARMLPELKRDNDPHLPRKTLRDMAAALWQRSPENPQHPMHALFLMHDESN